MRVCESAEHGTTDKLVIQKNEQQEGSERTLAVLRAAPYPVEIPQPRRHTLSIGAWLSTLAREMSATTVYSEKVLVPMKWKTCLPLQMNLEVLSGNRPWPWVTLNVYKNKRIMRLRVCKMHACECKYMHIYLIFWHRLVLGFLQNLHSPHWGTYSGTTTSP